MFGPKKKPDEVATPAAATPPGRKPAEESRPSPAPASLLRPSTDDPRPAPARLIKPAPRIPSPQASSSTMNPHLSFDGTLKYSGSLTVDCEFHGQITTDDTLIVGASGNVHAEVTVGVIEISGKVHGDIKARNRVKIHSGGEVYGNIETPTISMDEGVVFEGNCSRPAGSQEGGKTSAALPLVGGSSAHHESSDSGSLLKSVERALAGA